MEWTRFCTHGESSNHAFEIMCNCLFEKWCASTYKARLQEFVYINGNGGDGGIEAYAVLSSGEVIGIQSKWFPNVIDGAQIAQIESSFITAVKVRPELTMYIVCVPRDLSSKKVVKGGRITENNEEERWNSLVSKLKDTNPSVNIVLWNESVIQEKLLAPEAQGIYKFWFENSVVFSETIKQSFQKAIDGWAKTKYIPDIHMTGSIHRYCDIFLGSHETTKRRVEMLMEMEERLEALKICHSDILELKCEEALCSKIINDIEIIDFWIGKCKKQIPRVQLGYLINKDFYDTKFELTCSVEDLRESSIHFSKYQYFRDDEELLNGLEEAMIYLQNEVKGYHDNRMIILGNQGTGKTAGIISEGTTLINNHTHLPILVRAKDFWEGDTWLTILQKTLGFSGGWTEQELFTALENAALIEYKQIEERAFRIQPKCVICIDGIDESPSFEFWKDRINEAKAYEMSCPHIRFIFLSRPYVFSGNDRKNFCELSYNLSVSGDVSAAELCDMYFEYYGIDISGNSWIKGMFRTPFSLRVFCDLYRNRTIGELPQNSIVITNLFKAKIESLENDFRNQGKESVSQCMIHSALVQIAEMMASKQELVYEEIYDYLAAPEKDHLEDILQFLENQGFIQSYKRQTDVFSRPTNCYSWGLQPAFDYLIARKLFDRVKKGERVAVRGIDGVFQMLSIIAIEEDQKLLGEYQNIDIDDNQQFDLLCYAIVNASIDVANEFCSTVFEKMKSSISSFREIVNKIIIPVSQVANHPVGAVLLDKFLSGFKTPAYRDIWWSVPGHIQDSPWTSYVDVNLSDVSLSKNMTFPGMPLILAWRLSSVNNAVRQHCRNELTQWGIYNSKEFLKVFYRFYEIEDEQITEDIYAIAYGIALGQDVEDSYLSSLSEWVLEKVFSEDGLVKYENVVIRYYSCNIVKLAILKGLCAVENQATVTPPYMKGKSLMPINIEALNGDRMSGYGPIDYDLARYVLCDPLDNDFYPHHRSQEEYSEDGEALINAYKTKYRDSSFTIPGLIISMAYQYILNQGWDDKTFWEYEDKGRIGVDIAIRRCYWPATHGTQSQIMTVAEKYVWCAKHRIEAVFANCLRHYDWEKGYKYITDYAQLEKFDNAYQDYINTKHRRDNEKWVHVEDVALINTDKIEKESIEKWMNTSTLPNFKSWIQENEGMTLLYSFTNIINKRAGVEETIWISSGVVEDTAFRDFLDELSVYSDGRIELSKVSDFHSTQECYSFCTPQEACTVQSENETNASVELNGRTDKSVIVSCLVTYSLTKHENETEKSFYFPSKKLRELTGIIYGDGYDYYDNKKEKVAEYFETGENWNSQQKCLLINSQCFYEAISKNHFVPFWVFRVYRSPSSKAYELYGNQILHDTDKSFLVWLEGAEIYYKELEEIKRKPSAECLETEERESFEELLKKYGINDKT